MYIAPQNVHLGCGPDKATQGIQAPCETVSLYPNVLTDAWKVQSAVTTELDYVVGNVTEAIKQKGLWENTVVAFASDNGGPLDHTTNYPLRGGKHTFWDGGVRVVGFISGGLIPPARKGSVFTGLAHSSDWYATLVVGVAGGSLPPRTGIVPPDSVNLWQAVLSGGASPRTEVIHQVKNSYFSEKTTAIQVGDMKLILGGSVGDDRILAWPKPGSSAVGYGQSGGLTEAGIGACRVGASKTKGGKNTKCGREGCLFNATADPTENLNLLAPERVTPAYTKTAAMMSAKLDAAGAVSTKQASSCV